MFHSLFLGEEDCVLFFTFAPLRAGLGKRLIKNMVKKTKRSIQWVKIKQIKTSKYAGVHLLAEFWNGKIIEDSKEIERILIGAVKEAKNIPLKVAIHKF